MERLPDCIGTYEDGHESCDGPPGPDGAKGYECALRDLCREFRDWCADNEVDPKVGVNRWPSEVAAMMRGERHVTFPAGRARRAGPGAISKERAAERLAECAELASHFERLLRDRYGDGRFPPRAESGRRKVIFKKGTFYPVDRTARSRHIGWYVKSGTGHDVAVACLHLMALTGTVDAQLPYSVKTLRKSLSAETVRRLAPEEQADGQYQTIVRALGREGLGRVVSVIKRLDSRGVYPLPEPE